MKKLSYTKIIALSLIVGLTIGSICGCGSEKKTYKESITIDVFDSLANYSGIQNGWFGNAVEERFNMKMNIIAPNVSGGGTTLFDTRCAAGNLGDLIICNGDANTLSHLVNSGLIVDMSSYLKGKEILSNYGEAVDSLNSIFPEGSIYAIPSEISTGSATTSNETLEPVYGPYLRWDYYKELGYPEIETLEDLLPILKQMQENHPTSDSGEKTYGFTFFKDWDGNLVNCIKQPCCFYGYDEMGYVLAKVDGSDFQSIIDSDGIYVRVLRFYNKAYQMGLVDPASATQNIENASEKIRDGAILFNFWPWLSQTLYNTEDRMNEGTGFMMASIDDMQVVSYGCNVYGSQQTVICIGKNAKDIDRLADFIDWLYSDEGVYYNNAAASQGAAGPEGFTWEMTADGPVLTEMGKKCFIDMYAEMPEEMGGGTWEDGVSALNYRPVSGGEIAKNGYSYSYMLWPSYLETRYTALDLDWQEKMGAFTTMDYLRENNKLIIAPGCQYVQPTESNDISAIRNQCNSVITKYCWEMIFAEDDETFDALLENMQDTLYYLNYEKVLESDMKNAKAQDMARKNAASKEATYQGN